MSVSNIVKTVKFKVGTTALVISAAVIGTLAAVEGTTMVVAATPNVPRAVFNLFKAHSSDEKVREAAQSWNQVAHGSLTPVVQKKLVFAQTGEITQEPEVIFEKNESRILRLHSTKKSGNGRWANRIITEQWFAYQVMKADEEASKKLTKDYCKKHFPALFDDSADDSAVVLEEQPTEEQPTEEQPKEEQPKEEQPKETTKPQVTSKSDSASESETED